MAIQAQYTAEALPPWYSKTLKELADRANALSQEPYTPYQGVSPRIAPLNQDILRSQKMTREAQGIQNPYWNLATNYIGQHQAPFGEDIERYMNPYQQHVLDKMKEEGVKTLRENILPELEGRFVKMGQFGSTRHKDLASKFSREALEGITSQQQQALAKHYQEASQIQAADRARKLAAAREMGLMGEAQQGAKLREAAALSEQGRYNQNRSQLQSDTEYQDYLRRMMRPYEQIQNLSGILHGMQTNRQGSWLDYTPLAPQMNTVGQLGSLAGQIYGMRHAQGNR